MLKMLLMSVTPIINSKIKEKGKLILNENEINKLLSENNLNARITITTKQEIVIYDLNTEINKEEFTNE